MAGSRFVRRNNLAVKPLHESMNPLRALLIAGFTATLLAASRTSADAAADPRITTLLRLSRAAIGGPALERVKVLRLTAKATVGGLPGTNISWQEIGGSRYAESYSNPPLSGGDGYDGTSVWNRDSSGLVWVDGGQAGRASAISAAFASDYALWSRNYGGASVAWGGMKSMSGKTYDSLLVIAPHSAVPFEIWFDRQRHLPWRLFQTIGPRSSTTTFDSYRPVHGLMVPFAVHTVSNDGNRAEITVTRADVNPAGGEAHLIKPPSNVHDFSITGDSETAVPIDLADNHVYLDVRLNGKGPYRFIFDTGGLNLVDPAVAQEIGAIGRGVIQGGGVGSATQSISFAKVASLQIGSAELRDQLFAVGPTRLGFGMSAGQPVDGLIGFEVLSRFITTFDYAGKRVVLRLREAAEPMGRTGVLPFVFDREQPQFACGIDSIAAQCTLDTGARDSITLMGPFIAAHPQIVPARVTAVGVTGFGFGGPALGKLGRLQTLTIGNFTLPNVVADFTTQTKGAFAVPFVAGNVGGNIWKRFTLTLDYYNQTMALTPNASFNEPDSYERAGLFLLNRNGSYLVADVRPGTPAAQAGIVAGDTIVGVDGRPASSMSLQGLRELFYRAPGTVLHLRVQGKNGATRDVALTLRDFI